MIFGILGAPLLSWVFTRDFSKAAFEKRRQKFLQTGKGKDPMTEPLGPHKSFKQNLPLSFLLFFAIGFGAAMGLKVVG